jgi:hypothetical protein
MKQTLGFFFLAITAGALAQTPTVVEKPAVKTPASNVKVATSNAKPAPAAVKVAAVAVQKPSASTAAKVQPVAVKASPAPVAKANTTPGAKVNTATAVKATTTPAAKTTTPSTTSAKPAVVSLPAASSAVKVVSTKPVSATSAPKTADAHAKTGTPQVSSVSSASAQKLKVSTRPSPKPTAAVQSAPKTQPVVAIQNSNATDAKKTPKAMSAVGHRDPFLSPVVNMGAIGSGCSSGKRCLAIDQIALKGVVKSDSGMIAVVVNAMDKAYFLHENDPVFNGYVVKITGDSIVFKETFHDKLGKALTRDVTKIMTRPVA